MIRKTLGYILAAAGLVGVMAGTVPQIKNPVTTTLSPILGKTISSLFSDMFFLIIGVALVIVGLFFITRGGRSSSKTANQKGQEVPIYHGKHIVGYRKIQ